MLKKTRRIYTGKLIPLCAVILLISAILLWLSGFGFVYIFKNAVPLDSLSPRAMNGALVSVEKSKISGIFMRFGKQNTAGEMVYDEQYCVYEYGDRMFVAIRVTGQAMNDLTRIESAILNLGKDATREMNMGQYQGTMRPLDSDLYELLCAWVQEAGIDTSSSSDLTLPGSAPDLGGDAQLRKFQAEHIFPYIIEINYLGTKSAPTVYILSCAAALLILFALAVFITMPLGMWDKPVRALRNNGNAEEDFKAGKGFGKTLHIGREYTWLFGWIKSNVIKTSAIIWAYPRSKRLEGGRMSWRLVLKTEDKSEYTAKLESSDAVQSAMRELEKQGHLITTGYDKRKQEVYDKSITSFKAQIKRAKDNNVNNE